MAERFAQKEQGIWTWREKALAGGLFFAVLGGIIKSRVATTIGLIGVLGAVAGYAINFRKKDK